MSINDEILNLCAENGFVKSGFCKTSPTEKQFPNTAFLVCAVPYVNDTCHKKPEKLLEYGIIAPFARFNYYKETVRRLKKIAGFLRAKYGGKKSDYRIFCNSRINEKKLALSAGIGYLGINNLIITKESGSRIILAAMLMPDYLALDFSLDLKDAKNDFLSCSVCKENPACVSACRSGALGVDGKINLQNCIQWYAGGNARGKNVPFHVAANWGNVFYGCTKCQDVCPYNKKEMVQDSGTKQVGIKTNLGALDAFVDVSEFIKLSDDQIRTKFRGTALGLSWLTPDTLRRNALMCLSKKSSTTADR
ncbi:hypothetical protein FACS1894102_7330 [Spirochaetia bacterium]|nr:hypothetical protein FACS1894102_7330 [Spirochaetia bacterium]